jgi:dCTP deaminase
MVINGTSLFLINPIIGMAANKIKEHGVSYGLGEAGYDIRIKQKVTFRPWIPHYKKFVLASTIEEFKMPTNLVGIVHDKSTWARHGLSVFNTVIEPGWRGFLTLELVYHGREQLVIPAGAGIAQVIFHETREHSRYEGKYQDQEDRPVEAIESKAEG